MVPIPTVAQHLLCLSAIHIVIPRLLWDSAWPDSCNTTAAVWQTWWYTNYTHARSEVLTPVLMRIHIFWDVTVSKTADGGLWRCYIPSKYHPATHFHIPEARIFNLHLLVCLCRPNSCNPSKTKTNAALNFSFCTPLANDTTNESLPQDSRLLGHKQCNIPDDLNLHHQHQDSPESHITSSLTMNCLVHNSPLGFSDNLLSPGVGGRGRWVLGNAPGVRSTSKCLWLDAGNVVGFFTSGVGVLSATHSITLAAAHSHRM
jgi:hypothetical protein